MLLRYTILSIAILILAAGASAQPRHQGPHRNAPRFDHRTYPNAVTLSLPQVVVTSELGFLTGGIEYERFFGPSGRLSLNTPFYIGVSRYLGFGYKTGQTHKEGEIAFVAPGVRFHPYGNSGRVDFSLGIQAAVGGIATTEYKVWGHGPRYTDKWHSPYGALLLQTDLDFHPFNHGIFGFHMAFGPAFSELEATDIMFQFGIKYGGRF